MAPKSKGKRQKADSKRIVIDASVSLATGSKTTTNPTARNCRELLDCIRDVCHQLVLTDPIRAEWNEHSSDYAIEWRTEMRGKKMGGIAKTHMLKQQENLSLRTQVAQSKPGVRELLQKDARLIEAALMADRIIVTLDNRARYHFAELCRTFSTINDEIGNVIWVHPDENLIDWLTRGAEPQVQKQLRHYKPKNDH